MKKTLFLLTGVLFVLMFLGCPNTTEPPSETPKSNNANLQTLTVSMGTLSPAFDAKKIDYTVTVPYATKNLTITGVKADPKATMEPESGVVTLNDLKVDEAQTATIKVIAEDGTEKTYTVDIIRTNKFAVIFDLDGGTGVTNPYPLVAPKTKINPPTETPEKFACEFTGWTINGEPFTSEYEVTSDIVIKAMWESLPFPFSAHFWPDGSYRNEEDSWADVPTTYDPEDFIDVMNGSIQGYIDDDEYGYYGRVYHGMLFGKKGYAIANEINVTFDNYFVDEFGYMVFASPAYLGEIQIFDGLGAPDTIGTPEDPKYWIQHNIIINKVPYDVYISHEPVSGALGYKFKYNN